MPKKPQKTNNSRRTVIYARYSSHGQNDASIEQQVAECRAYAAAHQLEIVEVFADRAISGRSDRRPEFLRMMRQADGSRFDVVLSYKSNRIARNMLNALAVEDKLSRAGIDVVYCKEEFGNNAAGRFALRTMMNVNQFYSENLSEDVLRGMLDNAAQCRSNGPLPYGYRRGPDGRCEIDEPRAAIVREIYTRYAVGDPLSVIADDLNARCISTQRGNRWNKNSFVTILRNERYTGIYVFNGCRVPGGMPVIIEKADFEKVQEMLKMKNAVKPRRRGAHVFPLTGKLFCGHCGAQMSGVSANGIGGVYYYYECYGRQYRHDCAKKNIRQDLIEDAVVRAVCDQILSAETSEWIIDTVLAYQAELKKESQLAVYQAQLGETVSAIKNILNALDHGIFTASTKEHLEQLEADRDELEMKISAEQAVQKDLTRDQLEFWLDSFRSGDIDDPAFRKRLFDTFIESIYVYDDDRVKIVFTPDPEHPYSAPLSLSDINSAPDESSSSFRASAPPHHSYANLICLIGGKIVFEFKAKQNRLI